MAMKSKRGWLAAAIGAGLAATVLSALALLQLGEIGRFNGALASGRYADAAADRSSYGIFANAYRLQLDGEYDAALKYYTHIEQAEDSPFRRRVRYNMATLYMQRAIAIQQSEPGSDVTPLIELAKYHYKALLRADPGDWYAKYNLEQALKLSPDLNEKEVPDDVMPERSPESAGAIEIDRELP